LAKGQQRGEAPSKPRRAADISWSEVGLAWVVHNTGFMGSVIQGGEVSGRRWGTQILNNSWHLRDELGSGGGRSRSPAIQLLGQGPDEGRSGV
jgi:hypothetical protein